jgi:integrase
MTGLRGWRDGAILGLLLGCGLRRSEVVGLTVEQLQMREGRWVIVDLLGKGRRLRTVPVPSWSKQLLDAWFRHSGVSQGRVFRRISKNGERRESGVTANVVWYAVKRCARQAGIANLTPHDLRRYAESGIMPNRDSKMLSKLRESCRSSVVRRDPCGIIRCASQDMDEAQHSPSVV